MEILVGGLIGLLIGSIIVGLIGGLVLWIVSKLNLGLEVDGFGWAFLTAVLIGILGGIIGLLMKIFGISFDNILWLKSVVHLVVAAVVLMISGKILSGVRVAGFTGALVAAIAMGVIIALLNVIAGRFA